MCGEKQTKNNQETPLIGEPLHSYQNYSVMHLTSLKSSNDLGIQ